LTRVDRYAAGEWYAPLFGLFYPLACALSIETLLESKPALFRKRFRAHRVRASASADRSRKLPTRATRVFYHGRRKKLRLQLETTESGRL
jgi:hypothetical protein